MPCVLKWKAGDLTPAFFFFVPRLISVQIDAALVRHVANLAHLELTPEEVAYYETQLSKVMGYIEVLNSMPTGDLPADWRNDTAGDPTPERADVLLPSLDPEEALAAAPQRTGTAFQVPRIIE